jgi:hypothetical protein
VTQPMIRNFVDPQKKISLQQFRVAFRRAKLRLPYGKRGRPKKIVVKNVKKLSRN